ncbi:hypothetical protein [Chryseobacterium kwangjuense]|uniref:Uncharacterized protein n=1 Tax=Chryseobacterium kwangjuense TaxID=267125 RepID=A0A135WJ04_9FLAO|nr:hypothetical protein [Chryseobacterium kwangjuense]KXH84850.1 hypothetical protein AU378_03585 [Chryseobacterium kwangjuense]
MNMTFDRCALTGYALKQENLKPVTGPFIEYETEIVGRVKITLPAYDELLKGDFERYLIAGICKDRTLKGEDPILIDSNFIRDGYKKLNPPTAFEEKCASFLLYLYQAGGMENKEFEFYSSKDFTLAFADPDEFKRILDQLVQDYFLQIRATNNLSQRRNLYRGVKLTNEGKEKVRKGLPKMPLFGLVSQEISTGNIEIDKKINHARQLFFDEPQSMDKMRSACETLSYVLEPLRKDLTTFLAARDVSDFFQLVNTFDIRHNKETTIDLIYAEQLEWVFYTLLNSINTYTKLKNKGF